MYRWPGCAQEMLLWVGLLRTHQLRVKQVLIPVCKPLLCSWSSSTEEIVHLVLILDWLKLKNKCVIAQKWNRRILRKTGWYLENTHPPLPSVIMGTLRRAPAARLHDNCGAATQRLPFGMQPRPAPSIDVWPPQKAARGCNSIGTWQGLLACCSWQKMRILPGISGFSVPLGSTTFTASPKKFLAAAEGRSWAERCASVQKQLCLSPRLARDCAVSTCVCVCVCTQEAGERRKEEKKKRRKKIQSVPSLHRHDLGFGWWYAKIIGFLLCRENCHWCQLITYLYGKFTSDIGVVWIKKATGYFHIFPHPSTPPLCIFLQF